jgi:hypothetical protein
MGFTGTGLASPALVVRTYEQALEATLRGRSRAPMCYTNKHWNREEEEARRLRMEEARRDHERDVRPAPHEEREKKPLTEKVKEMVGAR